MSSDFPRSPSETVSSPKTPTEEAAAPRYPARFAGKSALVTGVSDRGIGGAICRRLADEGARLWIFGVEEPTRLVARLRKKGVSVGVSLGDVRVTADIEAALAAAHAAHGPLDVLVNNAGVATDSPLADFTDEQISLLLDVNLLGVIKVSRAALPILRQPEGVIVNISSATALGGVATHAVYSASKAGVIGFTNSLAVELAPKKQRCVAVAPGAVNTPMLRERFKAISKENFITALHKAVDLHERSALGVGLPEDVAAAVAFLASSEARWISGVTLPLGWSPTYDLFGKQ